MALQDLHTAHWSPAVASLPAKPPLLAIWAKTILSSFPLERKRSGKIYLAPRFSSWIPDISRWKHVEISSAMKDFLETNGIKASELKRRRSAAKLRCNAAGRHS
jgi:hypothetical protein